MRWALMIGQLLGDPRPEIIHLMQPEVAELRRSAPAGGWRCVRCRAPATHVQTRPGRPARPGLFWCPDHVSPLPPQAHNPATAFNRG